MGIRERVRNPLFLIAVVLLVAAVIGALTS